MSTARPDQKFVFNFAKHRENHFLLIVLDQQFSAAGLVSPLSFVVISKAHCTKDD